jgi:hypothetical protein
VKKQSSGIARIRQASWAGCAVLVLLAPAARAQGFFDFFDPSPQRIESQLERAGYELRAPIVRHGDVYIGDVLAANGTHERLVIDARTTKIVARYPAHARGWRDAPPEWRDRGDYADSWFGAPRPPRAVGPAQAQEYDDFGPVRRPAEPGIFARVDPSAPPSVLFDDPSARGANIDKPRPKPHVAKPKLTSPAAVAKAAPTAPDAAQAPDASAASPAENAKAAPAHADVAAPAAAEPAKPAAEPKPVAEATVAPAAPQPRPSPKPKALNDLPVTPLD